SERPMSFAEHVAANRRICLLRILSEAPSYRANESLLHTMVEEFGLTCTRDQIRTDLAWLRDQGLLAISDPAGVYVATITQSGLDVAAGRSTVPGVKRPSPR